MKTALKQWIYRVATGLLLIGIPGGGFAGGLATPFVDVQQANVPLGKNYTVVTSAGPGIRLQNPGSETLSIEISALIPTREQLSDGASPIPSASWIEISPAAFQLGPHEEKQCSLVIHVPDKKSYKNEYYQVMIWSRSHPVQSDSFTFGAGLLSRLRFRVTSQ